MNNFYIKKRKLSLGFRFVALLLIAYPSAVFRKIFKSRSILFVARKKIITIKFGILSQVLILLISLWVGDIFLQSLRYDQILTQKSNEISELRDASSYFEREFIAINEKLKKVNDYLALISNQPQQASGKDAENDKTSNQIDENDSKDADRPDRNTFKQIDKTNKILFGIDKIAQNRIKKIEKALAVAGLNFKRNVSATNDDQSNTNKGGPLVIENGALNGLLNGVKEKSDNKNQFIKNISHLLTLEKMARRIPFAKPMRNYFVSSGFGSRVDPINGGYSATHHGLDFVGPKDEKIISPSSGVVTLAERFSDYGNAIIVDHGYGITTRYGHLSAIYVRKGQMVKKGDIIGKQGSTGRSTGAHLHYEVRYKDTPLNPKRFLEAGKML